MMVIVCISSLVAFFVCIAMLMAFESYIDHYDFTEKEVRVLHPITVWMAFLLLFTFVASLCIATVHLAIGLIGIVATAMLSNINSMVNKRIQLFV